MLDIPCFQQAFFMSDYRLIRNLSYDQKITLFFFKKVDQTSEVIGS